MRIGYARGSTQGQKLDYQLDRLKDCDIIFSEKESGKRRDRPELERALNHLRPGHVFVITKLDRAARSLHHLLDIVKRIHEAGAELDVLDQQVDLSTPLGRLLFGVLGLIAEFENDLRTERVRDGLSAARARGLHLGPEYKLSLRQVEELRARRASGESIGKLAREFKLSGTSIYRYLQPEYGVPA